MKKLIALFFIFFACSLSLNAQNKKIDSLEHILQNSEKNIEWIKTRMRLNETILPTKTMLVDSVYNKELLNASLSNDFYTGKLMYYYTKGACSFRKSDLENAVAYLDTVIQLYKKGSFEIINDSSDYGAVYWKAKSLNLMGMTYFSLGQYSKALYKHTEALKLFDATKSDNSAVYINIGNVYNALYKWTHIKEKEAFKYYHLADSVAGQRGNYHNQILALGNIGTLYHAIDSFKTAIRYYEMAIHKNTTSGNIDTSLLITNLNNISESYRMLRDFKTAYNYSYQALSHPGIEKNKTNQVASLANMGAIFMDMGNYTDAEINLTKAALLGEKIGRMDYVFDIKKSKAELFSKQSNFKQAYTLLSATSKDEWNYHNSELAGTDSINGALLDYESKQEQKLIAAEKDVKIALKDAQIKFKNIQIYGGIAGAILLGLLGAKVLRDQNKKKQYLIRERLIIDLHSEFGSQAHVIRDYAESDDVMQNNSLHVKLDGIANRLHYGIENFKFLIEKSNHNSQALVAKMNEIIGYYECNSSINYQINLPFNHPKITVNPDAINSIIRVLQEAINNVEKYSKATILSIDFQFFKNNSFELCIKDNGVGFETEKHYKGLGIKSFKNLEERITNGKITISSKPNTGTEISFTGNLV